MIVSSDDLKGKEKVFRALANRRRLLIIHFLKKEGFANVGEISRQIKLSFKSTSRHLGVLVGAGILDKEQKSSSVFYQIASDLEDLHKKLLSLI